MDFWKAIDLYCERTDAGFLSEPINFFTNLAFIVAAFFIHRELHRKPHLKNRWNQSLTYLAYGIGVGSALFHSVATLWSQAADVIPIGIFLLVYIGYYGFVLARFSTPRVIRLYGVFVFLTVLLSMVVSREDANGSNLYFGTFAMLCLFCAHAFKNGVASARLYGAAAVIFFFALMFRTIDMGVCEEWSYGTHFLWHLLNGVVIFLVMKAGLSWQEQRQSLH